ncbi:Uncharacterised protein [Mycobacteroides abscessus subsp. abscessus]|nr:Uncharacterised protein [Mycobacteroides abscessus subsp. abscessus]
MPTSNMRSGKRSPKADNPVGPGIAAVMATMSERRRACSISSSENTEVQPRALAPPSGRPVSGSIGSQACI